MTGISLEQVKAMMAKGDVERAAKSPSRPAALSGLEKLKSSTMKPAAISNKSPQLINQKPTFTSPPTRKDDNSPRTGAKSKWYFLWVVMFGTVCILSIIVLTGRQNAPNIRSTNLGYWRSDLDSKNADFYIGLILKEYPSDLKTIYVENIIFTFKNGWSPYEQYLNGPFEIQNSDPKRFAFHLNGYTTEYVSQGVPSAALFTYYQTNSLLNVDEWIKRDACPFKKIQLQGFSADAEVELPETLDLSFPCDLDSVKICLSHDDFFGSCTKWAP